MSSLSQTLITGVYRTGSEYLAQLINCHPEISVSMYAVNVLRFVYGKYDPINDAKNISRALKDLSERLHIRYNIELDVVRVFDEIVASDAVDYGVFYDVVMSNLYLRNNVYHWAEKNQLLWREVPRFLEMMPNGKAVIVIRDPRSVMASFKKYTYAKPPAYLGAIFNCFDVMKYCMEYSKQYDESKFLYVRYEDVASNPSEYAKKIWRFLGLSDGYVLPNQKDWKDAYGNPWFANSSFIENEKGVCFDVNESIDRWKDSLTHEEVSLVEGVCGEYMQYFGYTLSVGYIDWLESIRLFIDDNRVLDHFRKWLCQGEGIQEFPANPEDPKNWERR